MSNIQIQASFGDVCKQLDEILQLVNNMQMDEATVDIAGKSEALSGLLRQYSKLSSCVKKYIFKVQSDIGQAKQDIAEMQRADQKAANGY